MKPSSRYIFLKLLILSLCTSSFCQTGYFKFPISISDDEILQAFSSEILPFVKSKISDNDIEEYIGFITNKAFNSDMFWDPSYKLQDSTYSHEYKKCKKPQKYFGYGVWDPHQNEVCIRYLTLNESKNEFFILSINDIKRILTDKQLNGFNGIVRSEMFKFLNSFENIRIEKSSQISLVDYAWSNSFQKTWIENKVDSIYNVIYPTLSIKISSIDHSCRAIIKQEQSEFNYSDIEFGTGKLLISEHIDTLTIFKKEIPSCDNIDFLSVLKKEYRGRFGTLITIVPDENQSYATTSHSYTTLNLDQFESRDQYSWEYFLQAVMQGFNHYGLTLYEDENLIIPISKHQNYNRECGDTVANKFSTYVKSFSAILVYNNWEYNVGTINQLMGFKRKAFSFGLTYGSCHFWFNPDEFNRYVENYYDVNTDFLGYYWSQLNKIAWNNVEFYNITHYLNLNSK